MMFSQHPPYFEVHKSNDPHDKPWLMLLHGVMSGRAQWLPNLEGLKPSVNLVLVELLGHGRSPSPADPACYSPQAYVACFESLRESLGLDHWFVCGQSFSAGLTMRYSLMFPQRVRGQVFTNSVSAFAPPDTPERLAERARSVAELRAGGRDALPGMRYFPRQGRLPDAVFAAMLEDAKLIDPQGLALGMEHTVPELSMRGEFHRTEVPTLLVNGAWEKAFQPVADLAGQLLSSLERVDLDGGHSVNAENPTGFNRAIQAFLAAHQGNARR